MGATPLALRLSALGRSLQLGHPCSWVRLECSVADGTGGGPVEGGEKRGLALARALGLQMTLMVTMASAPRTGLRQDLPSH